MEKSVWKEMEKRCRLCPRMCGADRAGGEKGYCGMGSQATAARAALHYWEEPCLSGEEGSGTVFFTGCTLRCVYCQNAAIAAGRTGKEITADRLAELYLMLQEQGANNINLVTPTHFLPQIAESLESARKQGLKLPIVYNTSGYERVETLKYLEGMVDIYLPDFKYWKKETAEKYSAAPDYPETARAALEEMVRQVPEPVFGQRGTMQKGVIVRHLLLPGHLEEGKRIVKYLHETYKDRIYLSLLNQYTPLPHVKPWPELCRKVSRREYDRLVNFALDLGVENGFIQEGETASESFIPEFDCNL